MGYVLSSLPIPSPPPGYNDKINCAAVCCTITFKQYELVKKPQWHWVKQGPFCCIECEAWDRALRAGKSQDH